MGSSFSQQEFIFSKNRSKDHIQPFLNFIEVISSNFFLAKKSRSEDFFLIQYNFSRIHNFYLLIIERI